MATFVTTIRFTEQGFTNIRESTRRANAFKAEAEKMGVSVTDTFWTLGAFDGLIVFDALANICDALLGESNRPVPLPDHRTGAGAGSACHPTPRHDRYFAHRCFHRAAHPAENLAQYGGRCVICEENPNNPANPGGSVIKPPFLKRLRAADAFIV